MMDIREAIRRKYDTEKRIAQKREVALALWWDGDMSFDDWMILPPPIPTGENVLHDYDENPFGEPITDYLSRSVYSIDTTTYWPKLEQFRDGTDYRIHRPYQRNSK